MSQGEDFLSFLELVSNSFDTFIVNKINWNIPRPFPSSREKGRAMFRLSIKYVQFQKKNTDEAEFQIYKLRKFNLNYNKKKTMTITTADCITFISTLDFGHPSAMPPVLCCVGGLVPLQVQKTTPWTTLLPHHWGSASIGERTMQKRPQNECQIWRFI